MQSRHGLLLDVSKSDEVTHVLFYYTVKKDIFSAVEYIETDVRWTISH